MKKIMFRISIALITFALGIFSVWLLISEKKFKNFCSATLLPISEVKDEQASQKLTGKIEVHFDKFTLVQDRYVADFIIENKTEETVYYSDYEFQNESDTISPVFSLKVNGREVEKGWCGTGLTSFPIKSGESKVFQVPSIAFIKEWKKGKTFQIGFSFSKRTKKEYKTVWSKNLPITSEIENKLSIEKDGLEKLTK